MDYYIRFVTLSTYRTRTSYAYESRTMDFVYTSLLHKEHIVENETRTQSNDPTRELVSVDLLNTFNF